MGRIGEPATPFTTEPMPTSVPTPEVVPEPAHAPAPAEPVEVPA